MRAVLILGVMATLLVLPAGGHASGAQLTGWSGSVGGSVPQGSPIIVEVSGPGAGKFAVSVYEQPFNTSYPTVTLGFTMPNGMGVVWQNVSIPTGSLYVGQVQVSVWNASVGGFATGILAVQTNVTLVNQRLQQIWEEQNISDARQIALLQHQYYEQELYFVTVVTVVAFFAVTVFMIMVTRSRVSERRFARAARRFGHRLVYEKGYVENGPADLSDTSVVRPITSKRFISTYWKGCGLCEIPQTEAAMIHHIQVTHKVERPKRGIHYHLSRIHLKEALRRVPDPALDMRRVSELIDSPTRSLDGFPES